MYAQQTLPYILGSRPMSNTFFAYKPNLPDGISEFLNSCRGVTSLLWNDIELSWKLHLPEHLFRIFTYKYGIVVTV